LRYDKSCEHIVGDARNVCGIAPSAPVVRD